ncbi:MAG TPA: D-2-hydroxyacid dehydrogenase [Clostridiales bacterium]|nr:D-2-hydroxyacid dehydrogenase [Clostridiales bacterium]
MKIVMPERFTLTTGDVDTSPITDIGEVLVIDHASREELKAAIADAEVLLINKTIVNEELLEGAEKLEYIGVNATGYNVVDLPYCDAHGITVTNAPGYSTNAVAQQVFAYLLEFYSRVHDFNDFVQKDGWIHADTFSPLVFPQEELDGKTIGLIGYGQIGKKVAQIASAFGMHVLAYSRSALKALQEAEQQAERAGEAGTADKACRAKQTASTDPNVTFVPLDELIQTADIVSVHCPLNAESDKLCNRDFFAKMKQGAFFINTARGPIVDEPALKEALLSGHLAGAGLDVVETEPMAADCPLKGVPNCIITPHSAWTPKETRSRLIQIVADNLQSYLDGHPINVVNHPKK